MVKIEEAVFLKDFEVVILLTDGRRCIYDLKPKLKTVRFYDLGDWEIFSGGQMKNGQVICWENGTELSLEEILTEGKYK